MPQNLSTAYQPTYRKVDMGVIGMGMAMGLTSTADLDGVVEETQTANAAIPEIATGALSQVAQGAANALDWRVM